MPQPLFAPPGFNLFSDGSEMPAALKAVTCPCDEGDLTAMPALSVDASPLAAVLH